MRIPDHPTEIRRLLQARRARLAPGLPVLAGMQGATVVAAAGGAATAVAIGVEGGGQDGGGGGQLLQPAVEHAADEGRVFGDAHGGARERGGGQRA